MSGKNNGEKLLASLEGKACTECGYTWTSAEDLAEREPVVRGSSLYCSECRSNRPKTETVKERAIYVYPPSLDMTRRWKHRAEEEDKSVSRFIIDHIEEALKDEDRDEYQPRSELVEEINQLKDENAELRKRNRMLDKLVERLDDEVKRYHGQPFAQEDYSGVRKYQRELVDVIQTRGTIRHGELLDALDINPRDTEVVKAINRQLQQLESYGIIKEVAGGYRWEKQ